MLGIARRGAEPADLLRDFLDLVAVDIAVSLTGLVVVGAVGLPRMLLALAFSFFVPGRAIVTNWPRLASWSEFGMPVVVSLAVLALGAATALWAHVWHPVGLFEIESGLSVVALVAGISRRHGRAAGRSAQPAQPPREADSVTGSTEPVAAELPSDELTVHKPAVAGEAEWGGVDLAQKEGRRSGDTRLAALLEFYTSRVVGTGADHVPDDSPPE